MGQSCILWGSTGSDDTPFTQFLRWIVLRWKKGTSMLMEGPVCCNLYYKVDSIKNRSNYFDNLDGRTVLVK